MAAPKTFALVALVYLAVSAAAHADGMNLSINVNSLQAFAGTGEFLGGSSSTSGPPPTLNGVPIANASNGGGSSPNGGGGAPVAPPTPPATAATTGPAAAFINFGDAPYSERANLADGNVQPWYTSSVVTAAFGHAPSAAEQAAFRQAVLQDIGQTYQKSLANAGDAAPNFYVTDNPNVKSAHMMSVASGVSANGSPGAIGLTDVGTNGFSFIDQYKSALTAGNGSPVANLEWAVAHNLSHELMHAFGVGSHPDQSGRYLDAASSSWAQLTDPSFLLSSAAIKAILVQNGVYKNVDGSSQYGYELVGHPRFCNCPLCHRLGGHGVGQEGQPQGWLHSPDHGTGAELVGTGPAAVPEPSTILLWVAAGSVVVARKARRRAA